MDLVKPFAAREIIRNRTKARSEVRETENIFPSSTTLTIAQLRRPANHPFRRIGIKGVTREAAVSG